MNGSENVVDHGSCAGCVDVCVCRCGGGADGHGGGDSCDQQSVTDCDHLWSVDNAGHYHCDYEIGAGQDDFVGKNGARDSAHSDTIAVPYQCSQNNICVCKKEI